MRGILEVKGIGESSKPPLLFVHGAWHGAWCWKTLMEYLAEKGYTSYAFDLPGHGTRASEDVTGLGIMDYVAEVESVIDELGLVKPILIGHSMGGLIVQKFLENNEAQASVIIAPCPATGSSLLLAIKYLLHHPLEGAAVILGRNTAIRNKKMCERLFFNDIPSEKIETHFEKLCLESSRAVREMVIPFFKLKAARITSTSIAVAAAGRDYFFNFDTLRRWTKKYRYDFLPFPEAAHNLLDEPDKFNFGKTIYTWLDQKIATGAQVGPFAKLTTLEG